ncbi:hypothetical protein J2X69_002429 [Algoriphagus sp. 4150]|uniref:hypothetical protein n=1 Tax=Algoriphagus sp. 4150 TaxID=2817756 RepID=UPI00285BBD41|nr:hypothetical protein [Algoriphagus sp. 4150]MDR7130082.1 hypothetical protein [Algoriphagus sp. 4150]
MKRIKNRVLIGFIPILFSFCSVKDCKFDYYKGLAKENSYDYSSGMIKTVFPNTPSIIDSDNKEDFFYRVSGNSIISKGAVFDLFVLKYKDMYLPGYWGERQDSVLFIPIDERLCNVEFVMFKWKTNGYFIMSVNDCEYLNNDYVSLGYSFKVKPLSDSLVRVTQFSLPKFGINITESEHIETANLLTMVVSKNLGILSFSYDFNFEDDYLIPWLYK